jgi:RNA polymerase sigma factor (TIGR02999 family)
VPLPLSPSSKKRRITQLLKSCHAPGGDPPIQLTPFVYAALRQVTCQCLNGLLFNPRREVSPIDEAYLRLVDHKRATSKDRGCFYRLAAGLLRRILLEPAFAVNDFEPGSCPRPRVDHRLEAKGKNACGLAALHRALERFEKIYPRKSKVVELRFFGGLDIKQIAEALGLCEETVVRDWKFSKLWLYRDLNGNAT